jgi:hypothetical protein
MTNWIEAMLTTGNLQRRHRDASMRRRPTNEQGTAETPHGNHTGTTRTQHNEITRANRVTSKGSKVEPLGDSKGKLKADSGSQKYMDGHAGNDDKARQRKKQSYEDEWQSTLYWP